MTVLDSSPVGRTALTPEQITIVQTTIGALGPDALDELAIDFYDRLFAADAAIAALFTADPARLRRKFVDELAVIVGAIRRLDDFVGAGDALGRRHRDYGVRASHYRVAGEVLLDALAVALGPAWTPETSAAWQLAYHLIVAAMTCSAGGV